MEKHGKIEPHRITKPIQLLAAWLLGLIIVNGTFLVAAAQITKPDWASACLAIASIVNVPLFLISIFLLQTKFRPEMQEDTFYSKYLENEQEHRFALEDAPNTRAALECRFRSIEGHVMSLEKNMCARDQDKGQSANVSQVHQIQSEYSRIFIEISHSVKSSLQAILVGVERLQRELRRGTEVNKDSIADVTNRISANVMGMSRLLDTIRYQSPVPSDVLIRKCTIKWHDLIIPIIRDLEESGVARNVAVVFNQGLSDRTVTGDIPALQTAIFSIIENAIKYSSDGGTVRVTAKEYENHFLIEVENDGIAIHPEDAAHIFDRGFRGLNAIRNATMGIGMGLFATHQIAKLHGGNVTIKSKSPNTTIVEFSLPREGAHNE